MTKSQTNSPEGSSTGSTRKKKGKHALSSAKKTGASSSSSKKKTKKLRKKGRSGDSMASSLDFSVLGSEATAEGADAPQIESRPPTPDSSDDHAPPPPLTDLQRRIVKC